MGMNQMFGMKGAEVFEIPAGTTEKCRLRRQYKIEDLTDEQYAMFSDLQAQATKGAKKPSKDEVLKLMQEKAEQTQMCNGSTAELVKRFARYHEGRYATPLDDQLCEIVGMKCKGAEPRVAKNCRVTKCRNGSWVVQCKDKAGKVSTCSPGSGIPNDLEISCDGKAVSFKSVSTNR